LLQTQNPRAQPAEIADTAEVRFLRSGTLLRSRCELEKIWLRDQAARDYGHQPVGVQVRESDTKYKYIVLAG
jgi:hypothetical protein